MRVALKGGVLSVIISKPEEKRLAMAAQVCEVLSTLSPADPATTEAAKAALEGLRVILGKTETTTETVAEEEA